MRAPVTIVLLGLLLAVPLAADAPKVVILDMEVLGQERNIWCWAAVSQMVLRFHRGRLGKRDYPEQCEIVTHQLKRRAPRKPDFDCCDPSSKEDRKTCMTTGVPEYRGELDYRWYRGGNEKCWYNKEEERWEDCRSSGYVALSWERLTAEIDQDRPIVLSWREDDGFSHIMAATGYVSRPSKNGPDVRWVVINDPWPPHIGSRYLVPYDVFVTGTYKHYWDQWEIAP